MLDLLSDAILLAALASIGGLVSVILGEIIDRILSWLKR